MQALVKDAKEKFNAFELKLIKFGTRLSINSRP